MFVGSVPLASIARDAGQSPDDERVMNVRLVRENCLYCHGEEMLTSQRLTPAQWKTSVEKMVGWGSPLPAEKHGDVIAYLAAEYPATTDTPRPRRISYVEALGTIRPTDETLATGGSADRGGPVFAKNCANCHGPDGRGSDLGPNLVEKPVLRRPADYLSLVRNGKGRMPAFATVLTNADEADLLAWNRRRPTEPPRAK